MLKILPRAAADGSPARPAAPIPNPATAGGRFLIGRSGGMPAPRPPRPSAGAEPAAEAVSRTPAP